jgi:tetratricopeptide (TPR) repeat protein
MIKTRLLAFIITFFLLAPAIAQVSKDQAQPKTLYENGIFLMNKKNYGGARSAFEEYRQTQDKAYQVEADYYIAICALKLYHLDGEKLIQDFINDYPDSPQSMLAYVEMGEYYFQDRNYRQAINYLSKVEQGSLSQVKRTDIQYKLAYSYFATKNFSKALVEFNKVKKSKSTFKPAAHYYAGFIEYDQENYEAALRDYLVIENEKAFAASVPYMITSIHYKSGDNKAVINYTKPIIDSKRKVQQRGQMAILLAEAYYQADKFSDAYFYFELAKQTEKFTAQSVYHFGLSANQTANKTKAISLLKSIAGQRNLVGAMASFDLAKIYLEEGNEEFAFTAFKSVIENTNSGSYRIESSFAAGVLAYKLGRYSECISLLTAHLETYPASEYTSQINDILAPAFLNTRNYKPALDYIESLEEQSPTVLRAYQQATYHYGVQYYNDRKFPEAIGYLKKSLENKLDDAYTQKANLWIAEAYSIGRRYEEALPYYNAAIKLGPLTDDDDFLRASFGRGYAFYNTAAYKKALPDYKRFVEQAEANSNQFGDALVRLADCYYVAKDYNTALDYFGRAIRGQVSEKDYAYYQAGVIYGIQGDTDKAITYLNRVVNVYKNSAYYDDALFERGLLQVKDEKYQAAIASFKQLKEEKARSPYVAFALERSAVANFNLGNYNETVRLYKEFIEKYPNNPGSQ